MTVYVTADTTIDAGTNDTFTDETGFVIRDPDYFDQTSVSLFNYGSIVVSSAIYDAYGVANDYGGWFNIGSSFVNEAGGSLTVTATADQANAYGYYGYLGAVDFTNDGSVTVSSAYDAYGAWVREDEFDFVNSGNIFVDGARLGWGLVAASTSPDTGAFNNSGIIDVHGGQFATGVDYLARPTGFENSGTIIATDDSADYFSVGVLIQYTAGAPITPVTYVNSGTIESEYAFYVDQTAVSPQQPSQEIIQNSGTIHGHIYLGLGHDAVYNSGLIDGYVLLGEQSDVYVGHGGAMSSSSAVLGGTGDDRLIGGDGADVFFGEEGADGISGGAGNDYIDGGMGSDFLDGGEGFDTISYASDVVGVQIDLRTGVATSSGQDQVRNFEAVVGSHFADNIHGSNGDDTLEGLQGADVISGMGGDDIIIGDTGADRLWGGAGDDTFIFSYGDGKDTIYDFQAGGVEDSIVIYGYTSYQSLVQQGSDTLVVLSSFDSILLRNVQASSLTAADFEFHADPLDPLPLPTPYQPPEIRDDYLIPEGATIGSFTSGPLIMTEVVGEGAPSIYNAGTFRAGKPDGVGDVFGIQYSPAGKFDNSVIYNEATGVIEVADTHGWQAWGIRGLGNASWMPDIYNAGRLTVSSNGNAALDIYTWDPEAKVTNTGVIHADAPNGYATGVEYENGGTLWNGGEISVSGGLGAVAVASVSDTDFFNSGTIRATVNDPSAQSIGFEFFQNAVTFTFNNTGTIEADVTIQELVSPYSDASFVQTFYNSGELHGAVWVDVGVDRIYNSGLITGRVDLGASNDIYDGRLGSEQGGVYGGAGADKLYGGAGADVFDGGAGADTLSGGGGNDTLTGNSGADIFHFEPGFGADTITDFTHGVDKIRVAGYAGYSSMVQQGADTLIGFSGGETILFKDVQASTLDASDFIFSAAALAPPPSMPDPTPQPDAPIMPSDQPPVVFDGTSADETVAGGAKDDLIYGEGGSDVLTGGGGADIIDGGAGNDLLIGDQGNDQLSGGTGADVFNFGAVSGDAGTAGQVGADQITDFNAAEGDLITLAPGQHYDLVQTGSDVDLELTGLDTILIKNTTVAEVQGAVLLIGPLRPLTGTVGSDVLNGGASSDYIRGLAGNDTLIGGAGDDTLDGGEGVDTASYAGSGPVTVDLSASGPQNTVKAGVDTLISIENLIGSNYSDHLTGSDGANLIRGATGADTIDGGAGDDTLYGGVGADVIHGGDGADLLFGDDSASAPIANDKLFGDAGDDILRGYGGNDQLTGGVGADRLYGGAGADKFIYTALEDSTAAARDKIYDFNPSEGDWIDLRLIDARTDVAGDQAFTVVSQFDGHSGEAVFSWSSSSNVTTLTLDVDGDKAADFYLSIVGHFDGGSGFIL